MQNLSQKISGAEHLSEVITCLKNADKYIRQGEIDRALQEISRAREKNPTIMYARAYEEYVRSAQQRFFQEYGENPGTSQQDTFLHLMPTLEKIMDMAVKEVKRSAISAYKQKEVIALQQKQEEEQQKDEESRTIGLTKKIAQYLKRARELEANKDFHNALNEVARAFMLDPTDERNQQIEEEIKASQEKYNLIQQEEEKRQTIAEKERREKLYAQWQQEWARQKSLEEQKKDEARKQARSQKIREYLQIARRLYSEDKIEDALSQLAFVLVLDPLNEEVLDLNWKIREAQNKKSEQRLAEKQLQKEEEQKRLETIRTTIEKSLKKAYEYLSLQKYSEALRVITQAYFIDPTNDEVIACERMILAAEDEAFQREEEERKRTEEERRRKQESEMYRLVIEQNKREQLREKIDVESKLLRNEEEVLLCLSKARGYLSQASFDEALNQIAKAFKINPFDEEIAKLQREILDAQKKAKLVSKTSLSFTFESDQSTDIVTREAIKIHLAKAKELRNSQRYQESLDEIAQAYRHDPMNEELFALEGEVQQEFLQFEAQQHAEQESTKTNQGVKKSLAMARECLSRDAYAEAIAWVDYAMSFDMKRLETLQLRDEIERAQRKLEEQKANEDKELVIQFHLSKAMELMSESRISEATLEVDLALRLNPNHKGVLAIRKKLNETGKNSVSV